MKLFKILITALLFTTLSSSTFAQLRLGAGGGFAFDTEAFTLFGRAGYDITDRFRVNTTFNYWFLDEKTDFGDNADIFDVNLDLNYTFAQLSTIGFYGLAGMNLTRSSVEVLGDDVSDTEVGLNLGVGGLFGVGDKVDIVTEFKYVIGGADQLFFNAGLMFNITGSR